MQYKSGLLRNLSATKQFSTFVGAIAPLAPMLTHYSRDQMPINNKFIG